MIVGALLDLGLDFDFLQSELKKLPIGGYRLERNRESRGSITGTRFIVEVTHRQPHRRLADILALIQGAGLPEPVQLLASEVFVRLGKAEAQVHGVPVEEVHFHEVGAIDSVIDIVSAAIGVHELGIGSVTSSAFNVGSGFADAQHGRIPVPAPATLEVLKRAPVFADDEPGEWTTPTGAAIVATLARGFGGMPPMILARVGYGLGARHRTNTPNVLRIITGTPLEEPPAPVKERVTVIEANIDDLSPQVFGYLMERAMNQGAMEFFYTPVQMKKDRPGTQLTLLCRSEFRERLAELIFAETTTIGLRMHEVERRVLDRQQVLVQTRYGTISVKVARLGDRVLNSSPEYEDCRRAAEQHGVPLREVISLTVAAFEKMIK